MSYDNYRAMRHRQERAAEYARRYGAEQEGKRKNPGNPLARLIGVLIAGYIVACLFGTLAHPGPHILWP